MINTVKWYPENLTVATETTKIVRMQQRRGLKQDLPKPLRPGEIGFATDSRQLFIGADTSDDTAATFNKTCVYEKTASAQSITAGYANSQVIMFTVPHRWYNKGDFNGATTSTSWFANSSVAYSSPNTGYFSTGPVFRTTDTNFKNILTGSNFQSSQVTVVKNGTTLQFSDTASISSSEDFFFNQTGDTISSAHTLTFRTPPSGGDQIGITYYGNSAVINAISNTTIGASGIDGFYTYAGISNNSARHLSNENILIAPDTGIGYIGLQYKHIQVATDVNTVPTPIVGNGSLVLGNLLISRNDEEDTSVTLTVTSGSTMELSPVTVGAYNVSGIYNFTYINAGNGITYVAEVTSANGNIITANIPSNVSVSNATVSATPTVRIDLSGYSNVSNVSTFINNEELWFSLNFMPGSDDTVYITNREAETKNALWAGSNFGFRLHEDSSNTITTLGLTPGNYNRANATIKAKLEEWLYSLTSNVSVNLFSNVFYNDAFNSSIGHTTWSLDTDAILGETYFSSRHDATNFSTVVNNLYYESVNPDIKGLMNIKTNIEFLTYEALAAGAASTTFEAPEVVTITSGVNPINELGANAASGGVNTVFVEYSIKDTYANNNQSYARVGTLQFIGDGDSSQVALIDTYSDVSNNTTGNIVFTGSVAGNIVSISANNSISPSNDMKMKFIRRRWSNTH